MGTIGIYCITFLPDNRRYIGKSINIENRLKSHISEVNKKKHYSCPYLYNAINKYGINQFEFRLITILNKEDFTNKDDINSRLSDLEMAYIDILETYLPEKGFNLTRGGEGCIPNESTREKLCKAQRGENNPNYGKKASLETRKKMSLMHSGEKHPMYGKHHSKEAREKMSLAKRGERSFYYGKHLSEETKKKLHDANVGDKNPMYGKKQSDETLKKRIEAHYKKIICLEDNKVFTSIKEASQYYNTFISSIIMVCQGKQKHTRNLHFKYYSEYLADQESNNSIESVA